MTVICYDKLLYIVGPSHKCKHKQRQITFVSDKITVTAKYRTQQIK